MCAFIYDNTPLYDGLKSISKWTHLIGPWAYIQYIVGFPRLLEKSHFRFKIKLIF